MPAGLFSVAEGDGHGRRGRIAAGVRRVLLWAGLIAVAIFSVWGFPDGSGFPLLLTAAVVAGMLLSRRAALVWWAAIMATVFAGTALYGPQVLRVAGPPSAGGQWWLPWAGSLAALALTAYLAGIGSGTARQTAAEEALRQEQVFTKAVLDSVPGIPYLFDAEGRLAGWNKKQEEMTGYPAEELAHMHITDWFRGEEVGFIAARMARVLAEGYADAEATLVTKDGTGIPFYFTGVRLVLDGKPYIAGMGIDISARKAAEEAIRQSEMLYRTLFESANDAIFILKQDVFSDCNPMATRIFGYPREELIGHPPARFSPARQPDGRDSGEVALEKIHAALEGEPQVFAWTHQRADGSLVLAEISLNRMQAYSEPTLLAIVRDVTERKKADESLRELSQAVEQSPVNVIITDTDGNIEYVNRRFMQVTGYTAAEVLGKNPRILKSGHTSEEEYRSLWQTITAGGEWSGEFLNKAKDGSLFWERALITSVKNEAGQISHFLAVKEDITERKQAEEALHQMHLQLTHVARLSTLGEMAAELAHELNHPLYAILNYAKAVRNVLAEEGPPDLESVREWNEEIADIARSAAEVVKRLRSFARRGESPRTACRIEEVVDEALGLVAVETRRAQVTVETLFSPAVPPIQADRVQIQQIFVNLLNNAMEAMQTVPADSRRITIQTSLGDAAVEVVVSDCGVGLPPGSETKIFEPYVTTKPQGLGMGLSIVRTIVEAHGGRLWATSSAEGGAAFHFTLRLEDGGRPNGV
ncbi:MAG: PAS domain S-box protein [Thermoguttaceae bacterium]